jgi:hypothetical protein
MSVDLDGAAPRRLHEVANHNVVVVIRREIQRQNFAEHRAHRLPLHGEARRLVACRYLINHLIN